MTLEGLQLAPQECVFIDNSEDNLVQARAVGMEVIWFDDHARDHTKLRKTLAALGISTAGKFS